jgi:hypothetical protein
MAIGQVIWYNSLGKYQILSSDEKQAWSKPSLLKM